ncbi:MAG: MBL fold metallo-hydrolase [Methanomicrobiales archaeon]|nr:MBL fold metallo-hydrolase [Methanomicrobiales archaeon]
MVTITVYDGAENIGGNKIYVEEGGRGVFLDFGKNFAKYGRFYEEYLKNRTTRGIHDLLHLRLIPPLPIYRSDLIPPDVSLPRSPPLSVTAILLSHAHLDHCGNLGLLDRTIPVVATPMSIAILKAMQDVGKSATESDAAYISERRPLAHDPLYLEADKSPYIGKRFLCTSSPSDDLLHFLSRRPGQDGPRAKKLEPGPCTPFNDEHMPFAISAHEVDHSIYGACAYLLRGEMTIAYTGDFRLHGRREEKTRDFVSNARDASILLTEGTRVGGEGTTESTRVTEEQVYETCRGALDGAKGLVIADFSARNFERLALFQRIAHTTGRDLVVTAKDLYLLHALSSVDPARRWDSLLVYDEVVNHRDRKWETEVVQPLASDRYISHSTIHDDPDRFLLCFSLYDMNHLLDIKPNGGTYLYSSCEPFNEEMEIDFRRLMAWLTFFRIAPLGFKMGWNAYGDLTPVMERGFHASGHVSGDDLRWVIDHIDPDYLIPIHTEAKWWFKGQFEQVIDLKDGESVAF